MITAKTTKQIPMIKTTVPAEPITACDAALVGS
jgi:hypothetical protein